MNDKIEYGSFTDSRDGKTYKTLNIGGKEWLAQNFDFDCYGSCVYENKPENGKKFGRLYDWHAAMTCAPEGWHLPTQEEWDKLCDDAVELTNEGAHVCLRSKDGWSRGDLDSDYKGSDTLGFGILGAGYFDDGSFESLEEGADFWTATEQDGDNKGACNVDLYDCIEYHYNYKSARFSVRLVRD